MKSHRTRQRLFTVWAHWNRWLRTEHLRSYLQSEPTEIDGSAQNTWEVIYSLSQLELMTPHRTLERLFTAWAHWNWWLRTEHLRVVVYCSHRPLSWVLGSQPSHIRCTLSWVLGSQPSHIRCILSWVLVSQPSHIRRILSWRFHFLAFSLSHIPKNSYICCNMRQ